MKIIMSFLKKMVHVLHFYWLLQWHDQGYNYYMSFFSGSEICSSTIQHLDGIYLSDAAAFLGFNHMYNPIKAHAEYVASVT